MKRFVSLVLVLCLILALSTGAAADNGQQYNYSTSANSGKRHEICTSLLGTHTDTYYTGEYTYDQLSDLSGDALLASLRTLMTITHTTNSTYRQCQTLANKTDCENGDGTSISLIYTSVSTTQDSFCGSKSTGWNREHIWPKSLGGFETEGAGGDLHHIRPSDMNVNGKRGNLKYGEVDGGTAVNAQSYAGNALGGHLKGSYFEPLDNVKGDVARICLYVYVRYGNVHSKCDKITNVFQSVDVLLEWCEMDPVDTWEMGRNEVVAAIQGNRNVFIDYPELAWLLFEEDIPSDMVTPSGEAAGGTTVSCTHSHTELRNAHDADCTNAGYTGDTYCSDCGKKLSAGSDIPALGHEEELQGAVDATCGADGYTGDTYCPVCDAVLKQGETVPATGAHRFGDWTVTKEATVEEAGLQERVCADCGKIETQEISKLESTPTDPTEPSTEPTEPATEPDTVPSEPSTTPSTPETQAPQASDPDSNAPAAPEADYRWLVCAVIAVGAIACIVVVLIQTRKKK